MPYKVTNILEERPETPDEVHGVKFDIVYRIRKMLDRALHKNTPEAEANNAMRLAQRELNKHNLEQIKVMAVTENKAREVSDSDGTTWTVTLQSDEDKGVAYYPWLRQLNHACLHGFKVEGFHRMSSSCL